MAWKREPEPPRKLGCVLATDRGEPSHTEVSGQDQRCNQSSVDAHDAAQALELVRALRDQLHEMTGRLTWLQRESAYSSTGRAAAIRLEVAALRRDIDEAQIFIRRLQRRYNLNDNGHGQARRHQAR